MKAYLIFLAIILLAVIGFLYTLNKGEIFIKYGKMWPMITSLAALITAILTLLMVQEMRWSREQEIKPELIIVSPSCRYEFRWVPKEDLSPIIRPELRKGEINPFETRLPVFGIKNIGKATALNVEVIWKINTSLDINSLSTSPFIKDFRPSFKDSLFCLNATMETGSRQNCFHCMNSEKTELSYCVATPSTEAIQPLALPSGISGSYDLGLIIKDRPRGIGVISGDDIHVELKYTDLNNKPFHKYFVIRSEMWYLPDSVSSESNSVEKKYHSDSNMRGTVRFRVFPQSM